MTKKPVICHLDYALRASLDVTDFLVSLVSDVGISFVILLLNFVTENFLKCVFKSIKRPLYFLLIKEIVKSRA